MKFPSYGIDLYVKTLQLMWTGDQLAIIPHIKTLNMSEN